MSLAFTEPDAGSDAAAIKTRAVRAGDGWVLNGHKWFSSGAHGARFAIVIACTDPDADPPQARNSAFLVDTPTEGWEIVRDVETMAGPANHPDDGLNVGVAVSLINGGDVRPEPASQPLEVYAGDATAHRATPPLSTPLPRTMVLGDDVTLCSIPTTIPHGATVIH